MTTPSRHCCRPDARPCWSRDAATSPTGLAHPTVSAAHRRRPPRCPKPPGRTPLRRHMRCHVTHSPTARQLVADPFSRQLSSQHRLGALPGTSRVPNRRPARSTAPDPLDEQEPPAATSIRASTAPTRPCRCSIRPFADQRAVPPAPGNVDPPTSTGTRPPPHAKCIDLPLHNAASAFRRAGR